MSKKIIYAMPLTDINLNTYIKNQCDNIFDEDIIVKYEYEIKDVKSFLQLEWGDNNDCTIISIATILYHLHKQEMKEKNFEEIYNIVLKYAKDYGYKDNRGTLPIFNKAIFEKSAKELGLENTKVKTKYFKNLGFDYADLVLLTSKNIPFTLSLFKDGRNYYSNHTINIIGYKMIQAQDVKMRFLIVYDNWNRQKCYLDFDKLNSICCINYI